MDALIRLSGKTTDSPFSPLPPHYQEVCCCIPQRSLFFNKNRLGRLFSCKLENGSGAQKTDSHLCPFCSITGMKRVRLWLPRQIHHERLEETKTYCLVQRISHLVFMKWLLRDIRGTEISSYSGKGGKKTCCKVTDQLCCFGNKNCRQVGLRNVAPPAPLTVSAHA